MIAKRPLLMLSIGGRISSIYFWKGIRYDTGYLP